MVFKVLYLLILIYVKFECLYMFEVYFLNILIYIYTRYGNQELFKVFTNTFTNTKRTKTVIL